MQLFLRYTQRCPIPWSAVTISDSAWQLQLYVQLLCIVVMHNINSQHAWLYIQLAHACMHSCTLHVTIYMHLHMNTCAQLACTKLYILTIKKCTKVMPPSLLRRFCKFLSWLIKKYKSDTKLAVQSSINMIGIRRSFLSTFLIGDEENSLYSARYMKHIQYIITLVHMQLAIYIYIYIPQFGKKSPLDVFV